MHSSDCGARRPASNSPAAADDGIPPPGAVDRALQFLFAPTCAACQGPLPRPSVSPVCDACWTALPRYPAALVQTALPDGIDWLRSLGPYDGSLRAILHALKYDGRQTLATRLAAELGPLLQGVGGSPPPLVVPVPLHPARSLTRGFNQAERLARALPAGWPVRLALARQRAASTQTHFRRDQRQENVAHAFSVCRAAWWRTSATHLAGAHVVLIDDVVTTGATLAACARVLREAGVAGVGAITVARTERRLPSRRSPSTA